MKSIKKKKKEDLTLVLLWAEIGSDYRISTRDVLYSKQIFQAARGYLCSPCPLYKKQRLGGGIPLNCTNECLTPLRN